MTRWLRRHADACLVSASLLVWGGNQLGDTGALGFISDSNDWFMIFIVSAGWLVFGRFTTRRVLLILISVVLLGLLRAVTFSVSPAYGVITPHWLSVLPAELQYQANVFFPGLLWLTPILVVRAMINWLIRIQPTYGTGAGAGHAAGTRRPKDS